MKVEITVRHPGIRDNVKLYAREKAAKLDHFFERITSLHVVLSVEENEDRKAEIVLNAAGGHTFVAEERDADPHAAIDLAVRKMERQLSRYKEKMQDRHRRPRKEPKN